MRYWWVSQKMTFKHEVAGGYMWSPKEGEHKRPFWANMLRVQPGDLIFSFADSQIKAVGIAEGTAFSSPKPDFGSAGSLWSDDDGWRVPVRYSKVQKPVRPSDFIDKLIPHLPEKYSPIKADGKGNVVYLAGISEGFAQILLSELGQELSDYVGTEPADDQAADVAEAAIQGRTDIGPTQVAQLVKARRGQGIFKSNVYKNEAACRVTRITDPRLLIASHIKPWAKSTDIEKLDGCNGLLLSPHVDRLFDRGLISFEDDGSILVSSSLPTNVLSQWGLDKLSNVGSFTAEQARYLKHHREIELKP